MSSVPRVRSTLRDEGFTLIEVLVAMVVLGTGVVALITALGMHSKTTFLNRNQSQAAATLTAAAEYVKSLPWADSTTCPSVEKVIPSAALPRDSHFTAYCSRLTVGSTDPSLLARIRVRVAGEGFDVSVDVVKRPQDAP